MTRATNARTAGVTFIVYFAAVIVSAAGVGQAPVGILLSLVAQFSAIVLAITLYSLTRDQDADIATLGLVCRVSEGVIGAMLLPVTLAVASLSVTNPPSGNLAMALASLRMWNTVLSALFFAVGSTAFCWLLLRGRMIPTGLAWLGVLASALMVVSLPLQLAGIVHGPVLEVTSLPIVFFELPLGVWLIVKGVAPRRALTAPPLS